MVNVNIIPLLNYIDNLIVDEPDNRGLNSPSPTHRSTA